MFAELTLWLPRANLIDLPMNCHEISLDIQYIGYEKLDRLFVFIFWAIVEDVISSFNIQG